VAKLIDDWRVRTHVLNFWSKSQSQSPKFSYSTITLHLESQNSSVLFLFFVKPNIIPPNRNPTFIQGLARFDGNLLSIEIMVVS